MSHDTGWWAAAVSKCGIITPNVKKKSMQWLNTDILCKTPHVFLMVYFTYTVEERETNYCTGVWKRNWYKMWCNKYKKFRFDRWAIKKTVQKFVFVHYTELDCCYTITSLYKAQPWGCSPDGKLRSAARGHGTFFAQSRADSHSYLCQKKQKTAAFRPLS